MEPGDEKMNLSSGKQYFFSTVIMFLFITILYTVQDSIGYETVSMILLLIIFILPIFNFSKGPIILAAVISGLGWDYYFIPPHFTMYIGRTEDVVMLFLFFIVAVTNGILASKVNTQKAEMLKVERRLKSLYTLVKRLSHFETRDEKLSEAVKIIREVFGLDSTVLLVSKGEKLSRTPHSSGTFVVDELEWLAADASFKMMMPAGKTTNTVSNAEALYIPVINSDNKAEVIIGIRLSDEILPDKDEMDFLRIFVAELKSCLTRVPDYSSP